MDDRTIKENLEKKSTQQLLDILGYSQDDYTALSIRIVKDILKSRGIADQEINNIDSSYHSLINKIEKTNSQKRIPFYQRILFWILTAASFAIVSYFTRMITNAVKPNLVTTQAKDRKIFFTDSMEQRVRNSIMLDTSTHLSHAAKEYYCNCYITAIRAKFPMPLNSTLPDDSIKAMAIGCVRKLSQSGIK